MLYTMHGYIALLCVWCVLYQLVDSYQPMLVTVVTSNLFQTGIHWSRMHWEMPHYPVSGLLLLTASASLPRQL